jgi:proteasome alpha subunit
MAYTPYDWTENLQHRRDYVQDQLREGSPVVGVSYRDGILLMTVRRTQDKVFEVYDRLMFSGVGRQADLESLRLAAIDFAHREGFTRSAEDVTAQRVVGTTLSPLLRRGFGDFFSHPLIARAIFAELGMTVADDVFCTLDYDGEFSVHHISAVVAGTKRAEEAMLGALTQHKSDAAPDLPEALRLALQVWPLGRYFGLQKDEGTPESASAPAPGEVLKEELQQGALEVAVMERNVQRESKFRHLSEAEIAPALQSVLAGEN